MKRELRGAFDEYGKAIEKSLGEVAAEVIRAWLEPETRRLLGLERDLAPDGQADEAARAVESVCKRMEAFLGHLNSSPEGAG